MLESLADSGVASTLCAETIELQADVVEPQARLYSRS